LQPDDVTGAIEPEAGTATEFSVALLGEFIRLGVRDIVLSPGSRSQALALAAAAWEDAGEVRLRVRIDERVAGFLALGLAVESRNPVILVTTSGTAVANLHPAVLEAHHSGVPLILLTADRPPELRGIGSNQTTDQLSIFGSAVAWSRDVSAPSTEKFDVDAVAQLAREAYAAAVGRSGVPAHDSASAWPVSSWPVSAGAGAGAADAAGAFAGPVQLNLAFREPLSGPVGQLPELVVAAGAGASTSRHGSNPFAVEQQPNTIVIAGHGAGPEAEALARALGVPLVAEISSGARFGPNLVVAYRQLLRDPEFGGRIRRAIVFGHPTLSREIPALLQRDGVEVQIVQGHVFEAYNPGRRAVGIHSSVAFEGPADSSREGRDWLGSWVHASRGMLETAAVTHPAAVDLSRPDLSLAREQLAVFREPVTRAMLVEAVWRTTWPHDRLVLGASRLIRIADSLLPGKKISAHANRGLAGIDGTIATAIGVALASQGTETGAAAGTTRVLLGDLAALYDVGALLFGVGEPRPRMQIIVANDGGGTIFDDLEVAGTAPEKAFDRVLYTPQRADFATLAAAYGWAYRSASNRGELDEALAATDEPTLIEVALPR
jgi:2-succinyl-5-enolpyruvyl-6-hydroxy-3-cyclohexene-1-carboxylate synthase